MSDSPSGLTWFLRCADCHKMYEPTEVLLWREGKMDVVWIKPRPVKKPKPCQHAGGVQRWDGSAWVEATMSGSN